MPMTETEAIVLEEPIGEDIINIVCAYDAIALKNDLTKKIWHELESRINSQTIRIDELKPKLRELIKSDAKTLRAYWCTLNYSQQQKEKDRWGDLIIDKSDWSLYLDAKQYIREELFDKNLIKIADSVLRYNKLFKKLNIFLGKYTEYKNDKSLLQSLLESWSDLFVVLVSPVIKTNNIYNLRTMNLNPNFNINEKLFSHLDETAYKNFYSHVDDEMEDIQCCDYRPFPNAGIRSLNCTYFNHLSQLISSGDHPAALLCGCRSGVQYQVRASSPNDDQIIGMVTIYFPFYGLWNLFGIKKFGFLFGQKDFTGSDKAYSDFLKNISREDLKEDDLNFAKMLLYNVETTNYKSIVTNLSFLSSESWKDTADKLAEDPPESIKESLEKIKTDYFDDSSVESIVEWYRKCTKIGDITAAQEEIKKIERDKKNKQKIERYKDTWTTAVNNLFKQQTFIGFFNTENNKQQATKELKEEFWKLFHRSCSQSQYDQWKSSHCEYIEIAEKKVSVIIDLFCFKITIFINNDGIIELLLIKSIRNSSKELPVNKLLSSFRENESKMDLYEKINTAFFIKERSENEQVKSAK